MTPEPCASAASISSAMALAWSSDLDAAAEAVPAAASADTGVDASPALALPPTSPLNSQERARQARACAAFGFDARSARQYSLLGRLVHHAAQARCDWLARRQPVPAWGDYPLLALELACEQAGRLLADLAAASYRLRSARVRLLDAQRELVMTHAYARCIGVLLAALSDASCVRRRWHDSESALALARLRLAADGAALALLNDRADVMLADARYVGFVGRPVALPEPAHRRC